MGCEKTPLRLKHTIIGKRATQKPRNTQVQTGSYKEAVAGNKMAVIHRRHPDGKLDQIQIDMIQVISLTAVDANPLGETPPQFLHSNIYTGNILDHLCK